MNGIFKAAVAAALLKFATEDDTSEDIRSITKTSVNNTSTQEIADLQFAAYAGSVHVDNSSNGKPGIRFPLGTSHHPVSNLSDAYAIATSYGIRKIILGSGFYTLNNSAEWGGFDFCGTSAFDVSLVIPQCALVHSCSFNNMTIRGTLDGGCIIDNCIVGRLNYFDGLIRNSALTGTVLLSGIGEHKFIDCYNGEPYGQPIIDLNHNSDATLRNQSGAVFLQNSATSNVRLDLSSGSVIVGSTVIGGNFTVRGVGKCSNFGSAIVDDTGLISGINIGAE
jgi:hypothetical protein